MNNSFALYNGRGQPKAKRTKYVYVHGQQEEWGKYLFGIEMCVHARTIRVYYTICICIIIILFGRMTFQCIVFV